jgi:hypothetical protein
MDFIKYINDKNAGSQYEQDCQNDIQTIVGPVIKSTYRYDAYDYSNEEYYVELKSRNCASTYYSTTMLSYSKIEFAKRNPAKKYMFFFKFTDGLYYHKYNPSYNYDIRVGGRSDRNVHEYKNYLFIPIYLLTKVI